VTELDFNPELGVVAIIAGVALLLVVVFVPARAGANVGGKVFLAGIAIAGLSWGIREIVGYRKAKRARNE
jgi:hypothetical protein